MRARSRRPGPRRRGNAGSPQAARAAARTCHARSAPRLRWFGPRCGASVNAMSSRSGGSASAARSGHSSSTTAFSAASSTPSSAARSPAPTRIQVGMHHGEARQRIGLHQREGRARHVERLVVRKMPDQRARERGLAGAEVARQRDEIARLEDRREVDREPARRELVREHDREAGRRDCEHRVQCDRISRMMSSETYACRVKAGTGFLAGSCARYSAASRSACLSGKTQVTVVPRPTAESSFTVPPCSSTKERTIDRPSPAPR